MNSERNPSKADPDDILKKAHEAGKLLTVCLQCCVTDRYRVNPGPDGGIHVSLEGSEGTFLIPSPHGCLALDPFVHTFCDWPDTFREIRDAIPFLRAACNNTFQSIQMELAGLRERFAVGRLSGSSAHALLLEIAERCIRDPDGFFVASHALWDQASH
ncbi:MAG: hypothetical protein AB1793_09585 [Candidatus Thermoplasmatota archaeon]